MRYILAMLVSVIFVSNACCQETPSMKSKYALSAGLGIMWGQTAYEIGGHYETGGQSGNERFPISELKFPLNVYLGSLGGRVNLTDKIEIKATIKKNISTGDGKMTDTDWGVFYDELDWWTNPNSLDAYSKSDANLDAIIADLSLRYYFIRLTHQESTFSFFIGGQYIYQKFDLDMSHLNQWYPSLNAYAGYDVGHDYASGKVITYEVTKHIPAVITGMKLVAGPGVAFDVMVGYAPYAVVNDEDHHLLRSLTSHADCNGDAVLIALSGDYRFHHHWSLGLKYDFTKVDTKGDEKQYLDGKYSATTQQKNFGTTNILGLTLSYRF